MDAIGVLRLILSEECGVDPDLIQPHSHLLDDLEIDSLDLLNATFRLQKDHQVKLPVEEWLRIEYGDMPSDPSPFLVSEVCRYLAFETEGVRDL